MEIITKRQKYPNSPLRLRSLKSLCVANEDTRLWRSIFLLRVFIAMTDSTRNHLLPYLPPEGDAPLTLRSLKRQIGSTFRLHQSSERKLLLKKRCSVEQKRRILLFLPMFHLPCLGIPENGRRCFASACSQLRSEWPRFAEPTSNRKFGACAICPEASPLRLPQFRQLPQIFAPNFGHISKSLEAKENGRRWRL